MLGLFSSKPKSTQVGVDFTPTGVAAVEVTAAKKNCGMVRNHAFLAAVGAKEQARVLQQWVEQNGLKKTPCVSLIAKHDVQIFQLEKPSVEENELLQAVSWKVKDLVNFDVSAAVVDIFEMPPSPKSPVSYINAVVARETVVKSYVDIIKHSGLELNAIDVHDLVPRNYQLLHDDSGQSEAILQFTDNHGSITIYHDQNLYVARDFKIGLLDFESLQEEDAESLYDNLLLELQRSMDYFEATYGLAAVQRMVVFPQTPVLEKMAKYMQNYLPYELDFAQIKSRQNDSLSLDPHCFSAYCAALRGVGR
jgi:MSHA biogenesis protein MshI